MRNFKLDKEGSKSFNSFILKTAQSIYESLSRTLFKMGKLNSENSQKIGAIALATAMALSPTFLSGCSKKVSNNNTDTAIVQIENSNDSLKRKIRELFPTLGEDVINNSALIILLDEIAKEDENGKINSEYISLFKSKVDVDNMISDYNSFINVLEQTMISSNKIVKASDLVVEKDKEIMKKLELLTSNVINGSKEEKISNIKLIYTLFVEEKEVSVDGLTFEIRDLSYSSRTIASAYARTAAYYAREYITEDMYKKIDDRTNDQNNKSEIKIILEILSNEMKEVSQADVIKLFNNKYEEGRTFFEGKITVTKFEKNNLINFMNIEYLNSDKVANKDKNEILEEYTDKQVLDALNLIDAITKYNQNNPKNIIKLSTLLVDEYTKTEKGKEDIVALDYIQYNVYMFLNTTKEESTFNEIYNNPYFKNINEYLCGRNFSHDYSDGTVNVDWQDISDGVKFVCNEMVIYAFNNRPVILKTSGYESKSYENLEDSIRYLETAITGECKKVDMTLFIKQK